MSLVAVNVAASTETARVTQPLACDPAAFSMSRFALDTSAFAYHLVGKLDAPTPGYSARLAIVPVSAGANPFTLHLTLQLQRPESMSAMVISPVNIDATIRTLRSDIERVQVRVEKRFSWGIERLTCVVPFE
ncbi:MAG: hypothetical protein HOI95_24040 [Chromatiales bacterium]|nr:hypothetical protein [Chromatiales bacterium]